ncbi:MAG: apolipoprotein N-acyltransferase [Pseudorhodobacter sp.]|nr:apolipoprotein N-acyltransferase [Pseudorhodobacter sp.]
MNRRRWGLPGAGGTFAALGCGAALAAGQAPLGLWGLALAGLVGLTAVVASAAHVRAAAWTGLLAGAAHFTLALSWLVSPFLIDAAHDGWMAPFAVLLMAVGLALFWAAAAAASTLAASRRRRALAFALALSGAELARGYVLTGFPWATVGHIWIDTPLAQLAALLGAGGLTLLATLAAALPVAFGRRGLAGGAALLAAAASFGLYQLAQPAPAARPIMLRLVQPDAAQHLKWDPDAARLIFARLLAYTAARPAPDLVIWPETSVPWLLEAGDGVAPAIAAAGAGAPVAVGIQRVDGARYFNSLAVIGAAGAVAALYDKHHLVPFGEYVPFGDAMANLFGVSAFAARLGNGYSAGPGAAVLDLGPRLGRVLPLICYEAVFPQDLRAAPSRPDWILQITNDAWFGTMTGPYQHLAQARLRAIEQGLPLVRVANTGVSAVIDARGRVVAQIALGQAAYLDAALPAALAAPLYARWGEWPLLLLLAGLGLPLVLRRRTPKA